MDLVLERPGLKRALIEIKSTKRVTEEDVRGLASLADDISRSEAFCLSLDTTIKKIGQVTCLPWQQGLLEIGL